MSMTIVLLTIIVALAAACVYLSVQIHRADAERRWELAACPVQEAQYDTLWDRLVAEQGDPTDVSTSGAEFAMPKAS